MQPGGAGGLREPPPGDVAAVRGPAAPGAPTSGGRQHVREPLPRGHHLWVLLQICKVLPDSDGAVVWGREGKEVETEARCWHVGDAPG